MTAQLFPQTQNYFDIISTLNTQLEKNPQVYTSENFAKNSYVYRPFKNANQIYIVKEGRIKVGIVNEEGKEIIKKVVTKGEFFGELALIGQSIRKDYALAMENTEVYILTVEELQYLMQRNKSLNLHIMQTLGRQLIEFEQRLESLVFDNSRNRIINFLESLVNKRGQRVGYEMLVKKFFTHQEIANLTATSRQTVTMVLNELRNKNILTFNRRRLLIRDMELLRAEAA